MSEEEFEAGLSALLRDVVARDHAEAGDAAAKVAPRVLADFDVRIAGRNKSLGARIARGASRLADAAWPGAPLWKPACALGLSLAIGLGLGAVLPFSMSSDESAYDSQQSVDLAGDLK